MSEKENIELLTQYPFLEVYKKYDVHQMPTYEKTWYDMIPEVWRKKFGKKLIDELRDVLEKSHYIVFEDGSFYRLTYCADDITPQFQIKEIKFDNNELNIVTNISNEKIKEVLDKYKELSKDIKI